MAHQRPEESGGELGAASAGPAAGSRVGFTSAQAMEESGYDDAGDTEVRTAVGGVTGNDLVDEDYSDVADGALIWWRDDDGDETDLTDLLVDALDNLDDGGVFLVMTPKPGRGGHEIGRASCRENEERRLVGGAGAEICDG